MLAELEAGGVEIADSPGAGGRAYATLRAGILRNLLPPGTVLSEAELASALGISRTPVRSALQMLLHEGLLELGPKRQVFVRGVADAEGREVMLLRAALERVAVAEATPVIELAEIDELRLIVMRQRRAADRGDVEGFIDLDDLFHLGIARRAHLPLLEKLLGQLRAFVRIMGLRAVSREGRLYEVLEEHEAILQSFEARDAVGALHALDRHLARTYALLEPASSEPDRNTD